MSLSRSVRDLSTVEFESLVEEALENLPDEFKSRLANIVIAVEEEPSPEDVEGHAHGVELLGIYRGIPLPFRSVTELPALPDQIAIFRGPILRVSTSRAEAVQEIRETVIHELGHYFGLSDEDMER